MRYIVEYERRARTDLRRLNPQTAQRVREAIEDMAASAATYQHKRLTGALDDQYSLRVGDYRVRYTLDHANRRIVALRALHRSVAYRRR